MFQPFSRIEINSLSVLDKITNFFLADFWQLQLKNDSYC